MKIIVRLLLSTFLALTFLWATYVSRSKPQLPDQRNLILALELGQAAKDADSIARQPAVIEQIQHNTNLDYTFIVLYTLSFAFAAWFAFQAPKDNSARRPLAGWARLSEPVLQGGCAIAIPLAAILDLLENRAISLAIHATPANSQLYRRIGEFGYPKWFLICAALALIGMALRQARSKGLRVAGAMAAGSGLVSAVLLVVRWEWLPLGLLLVALALATLLFVSLADPKDSEWEISEHPTLEVAGPDYMEDLAHKVVTAIYLAPQELESKIAECKRLGGDRFGEDDVQAPPEIRRLKRDIRRLQNLGAAVRLLSSELLSRFRETGDPELQAWQYGSNETRITLLGRLLYADGELANRSVRALAWDGDLLPNYPAFILDLARAVAALFAKWFLSKADKQKRDAIQALLLASPPASSAGRAGPEGASASVSNSAESLPRSLAHRIGKKLAIRAARRFSVAECCEIFLADIELVSKVAHILGSAVPFNVVFHRELNEIGESRKCRAALQPEDEMAALFDELDAVSNQIACAGQEHEPASQPPATQSHAAAAPTGSVLAPETGIPAAGDAAGDHYTEWQRLDFRRRTIQQKLNESTSGNPPPPPTPGSATSAVPGDHESDSPFVAAESADLLGLSLSGGGIRSATFGLGILQGMADIRLLRRVDYLSTVSGGGYIGAWLTSWAKRLPGGIRKLEDYLSPRRTPTPTRSETTPIRFLREYSNYLSPRPGMFSADTWTIVTTWLRNTLLNQTVLVLFLASVLLLPRAIESLLYTDSPPFPPAPAGGSATTNWTLLALAGLVAWLVVAVGINMRFFSTGTWKNRVMPRILVAITSTFWIHFTVLIPLFLWCVVATYWLWQYDSYRVFWPVTWLGFGALSGLALFGRYDKCKQDDNKARWRSIVLPLVLAIVLPALLAGALSTVLVTIFCQWGGTSVVAFGIPLVLGSVALVFVLNIGLLGLEFADERREWWSRLGAWMFIYGLAWLASFLVALYVPRKLIQIGWLHHLRVVLPAAGAWILSTAGGLKAGKSPKTSSPNSSSAADNSPVLRVLAIAAPYAFALGLLILIALGLEYGFSWYGPAAGIYLGKWSAGATALAGFLAAFILAWRFDVNEFSMHHFYRNRLVRCYLGATRTPGDRSPQRFTGFDPDDDLKLASLRLEPPAIPGGDARKYVGPLPIVNVALNLVKGKNLAWQERKAVSFFFTPLDSGYQYQGAVRPHHSDETQGFRPTDLYGYPGGVSIGTATAISGAAANPNMGSYSSPALAFLMTLFNVRLGWWMGNPRRKKWNRSSPRVGLLYLLKELTAGTSDDSEYVNLSDGGHFENLGIYELVRRRCRYIIASDAEADRGLTFAGLANAVRKCRVDAGVDIDVRMDRIRTVKLDDYSQAHCVVGTIRYPHGKPGRLVYLKASLTGDESVDVLQYKARNSTFPHQSTGDQFFDESQFESYRKLGHHVFSTVFQRALPNNQIVFRQNSDQDMQTLVGRVATLFYAPSRPDPPASAATADLDQLRRYLHTIPLPTTFNPKLWPNFPTIGLKPDELLAVSSMLQVMERVYLGLALDDDPQNPQAAGWLILFRHWMAQGDVQRVWNATKPLFDARFQGFVDTQIV